VGGQQGNLLIELQREGQAALQRGAAVATGRGNEVSGAGNRGRGGVGGSEKASEKGAVDGGREGDEEKVVSPAEIWDLPLIP